MSADPAGVRRRLQVASISCAAAPVALIGGFIWAGARQPAGYDAWRDTISALASRGALDRQIMTTAFVLLGLCHLVSGYGLRRPLLALGGVATGLLALAPQPAHGSSAVHLALAAIALVALSLWTLPGGRVDRSAAVVLSALLIWFFIALQTATGVGLAERVLTVAQALWPIVAVRQRYSLDGRQRPTA